MTYDRSKKLSAINLEFSVPFAPPTENAKSSCSTGAEASMLARSVEIMETWSLLFGPATIECAYLVDGRMFVRLTNGRLLVDPEKGAGLVVSNQHSLS